MIAQNAPRVLQKIHNPYLVVIGQMVLADGAEVGAIVSVRLSIRYAIHLFRCDIDFTLTHSLLLFLRITSLTNSLPR